MSAKKPTARQKQAINNILSGNFRSKAAAMRDAGYGEDAAKHPKSALLTSKGVGVYIKTLDKLAQAKFNDTLGNVVMKRYLDGIDATKRVAVGKRSRKEPDFAVRKTYLDKFAEFFGWTKETSPVAASQNQYNFFMVGKEKQDQFNDKFKGFLKNLYK
jgi:hypothetical protein